MEFEPMLTPREKSPLPENVPRGGLNPRHCRQQAQALPTELFGPPITCLRCTILVQNPRYACVDVKKNKIEVWAILQILFLSVLILQIFMWNCWCYVFTDKQKQMTTVSFSLCWCVNYAAVYVCDLLCCMGYTVVTVMLHGLHCGNHDVAWAVEYWHVFKLIYCSEKKWWQVSVCFGSAICQGGKMLGFFWHAKEAHFFPIKGLKWALLVCSINLWLQNWLKWPGT